MNPSPQASHDTNSLSRVRSSKAHFSKARAAECASTLVAAHLFVCLSFQRRHSCSKFEASFAVISNMFTNRFSDPTAVPVGAAPAFGFGRAAGPALGFGRSAGPAFGTAVAPSVLSAPWIEVIDPTNGRPFYVNTQTNESSWNRPSCSAPSPFPAAVPKSAAAPTSLALGGGVAAPVPGALVKPSHLFYRCSRLLAHMPNIPNALSSGSHPHGLPEQQYNCLHLTGVEGSLGSRINGKDLTRDFICANLFILLSLSFFLS